MPEQEKERPNTLFTDIVEESRGLTISDLNRYLPAVRKSDEIKMSAEEMKEGLFLAVGGDGLSKLPTASIDLILADPPENPWQSVEEQGKSLTLKEYYQWNENWLEESHRVLKSTGVIYLFCGWHFSGLYQSLLSNSFNIHSRISWRNRRASFNQRPKAWRNMVSDIWFASKTGEFLFNQEMISTSSPQLGSQGNTNDDLPDNLWIDIFDVLPDLNIRLEGDKPDKLIERIMDASSFKLNWIVDPFMRNGGTGVIAKRKGRRFIGFEVNQDRLLLAMKRIDQA